MKMELDYVVLKDMFEVITHGTENASEKSSLMFSQTSMGMRDFWDTQVISRINNRGTIETKNQISSFSNCNHGNLAYFQLTSDF
jgi:hypothetical protein